MKPLSATDPRKLGKYTIEQLIDSGGMGRVYLGRSPSGQLAAVKVMSHLDDPQARERFQREFNLARRVKNHYLAEIFDSGSYEDTLWYASEYIPGPTLQQAINMSQGTGLGEAAASTIALTLCRVLEAIHAQGITHRDLKPGNIILSANGPRVIDFGIAHLHGYTLTSSSPMGTHGYVAPERYLGGKPQASWDIFALGVIVSYAATGRMPFPNSTPEENWHAVLSGEPDLRGVPASLTPFVRRCLDKDLSVRSSIASVQQEINGLLKDDVRNIYWLPDYVQTEIIKQTKQLPTEPYRPTRPYTATTKKLPVSGKSSRPSPAPAPRKPGPSARPAKPLPSSTHPQRRGGTGWFWALVALVVVVGGGWAFAKDNLKIGYKSVEPPLPQFTAAKRFGIAHDPGYPGEIVAIKGVRTDGYQLKVTTAPQPTYVGNKVLFNGWCINVQSGKQSTHIPIESLVNDDDPGTTATMTVNLTLSGQYSLLPYCMNDYMKQAALIGTATVKNLAVGHDREGNFIAIAGVRRSGSDVSVAVSYLNGWYGDVCVRNTQGIVQTLDVREKKIKNGTFRVLRFKNLSPGSSIYPVNCSTVTSSYKGSKATLP